MFAVIVAPLISFAACLGLSLHIPEPGWYLSGLVTAPLVVLLVARLLRLSKRQTIVLSSVAFVLGVVLLLAATIVVTIMLHDALEGFRP